MEIVEMLDECLVRLNLPSDYALAREWNIAQARLSAYRHKVETPDVYVCFKIAEVLGESPSKIIATFEMKKAKKEHKALYFKDFLTSVGLWITLAVIPLYLGVHSESVLAAGTMEKSLINQHNRPLYEVTYNITRNSLAIFVHLWL